MMNSVHGNGREGAAMRFADRLQELRHKAGLSQSQLADKSGIPVWTIRGYEQGKRQPTWDGLFRLAWGLGVSSEAFAVCVEIPPPTPGADKPKRPRATPAAEEPIPTRGRPPKAK
jgi:transcriptional regulator with XRE-family HTH domain